MISGQLPLDLHILSVALKSRVRLGDKLNQDWKGKNGMLGHLKSLDKLLAENNFPLPKCDGKDPENIWEDKFTINKDSLHSGNNVEDSFRLFKLGGWHLL